MCEAYPSLWRDRFRREEGRTPDQHDAFSIAAWMRGADRDGELRRCLEHPRGTAERSLATVEGWILGVA